MAITESWIGRHPDDPEGQFALFVGGSLRGTRFPAVTKHCWGVSFRYRGGRSGASTPAARAAAYLMNSSGAPAGQLGYGSSANLSILMANGSGLNSGEWITSPVASVAGGPTNAAIPIASGSTVLLALLVTGASANVGFIEAALSGGSDNNLYDRSGLSQPPPNPYGSATPAYEGQLTIGLLCHDNDAPVVPVNRTPGSTDPATPTAITTTAPTFAADHRDRNGAWGPGNDGYDDGDYLNQFRIELQQQSGSTWTSVWSPTLTADGPMRASNRFTVDYTGTLTRGAVYRWRCQTSDYFDAWGSMSGWLYFSPANLGLMTLSGAPTGKIETQQPATFAYTWSHQTALATNAVEIQLYRNGNFSQASPTITKTTVNNVTDSVTWAQTAFATLLWGQSYSYRMRGRDTSANWSAWSPLRSFTTNASPGIPDGLSPSNSQIVTSLPLLTARMTDADDTVATGLVLKFRIKDNAGTVLQTRTATYNATTLLWEYQTIAADFATFATYKVDAYSYDGTIYSGGVTVEANAVKSAEAVIVYASGPVVAITAPASAAVIANSTPTVTWTCSTQNRYRVRIYEPGTTTVVYERGWITSSAVKSWAIEAGFLRNNHAYELEVGVEDTAPLQGFSARLPFTTAYTEPATPTGFSAVPASLPGDPWPTAILVQAAPSTINPLLFVSRNIYRDDVPNRPIKQLFSASDTAWLDATPRSGVTLTYTWRDVAYVDASHTEQIESAAVSSSATLQLRGVVLSSVIDPEGIRTCLESVQARGRQRNQDKAKLNKWTAKAPTTYYGVSDFVTIPGTYRLLTTEGMSANERERQLEALLGAKHTLCYRDERGRRYFVVIDESNFDDRRVLRSDVALTFVEEHYREGVYPG